MLGVSSGATHPGDVSGATDLALSLSLPVLELSVLNEAELPDLELFLSTDPFLPQRTSLHAPSKNRVLPEDVLVDRFVKLGLPTVVHPDVVLDFAAWRPLGSLLLVENSDARKAMGQTPSQLQEVFELLPEAGFCLDVSHALDVGGVDLVLALALAFSERLVQLHLGCGAGSRTAPLLEDDVLSAFSLLWAETGPLPVVLERTLSTPSLLVPILEQVRPLMQ